MARGKAYVLLNAAQSNPDYTAYRSGR